MKQFVRVHQALLNILIGKAGLFSTVPFIGAPVAAVLRQIEGVVDVSILPCPLYTGATASLFGLNFLFTDMLIQTIAFMLIDTFQARASDFQNEAGALKGSITVCIGKYEGIAGGVTKRTIAFPRREIAEAVAVAAAA